MIKEDIELVENYTLVQLIRRIKNVKGSNEYGFKDAEQMADLCDRIIDKINKGIIKIKIEGKN